MENEKQKALLNNSWFVLGLGILLSAIFLLYGVRGLVLSYSMTSPFEFLMFFFSSSMIILINATILLILLVTAFLKLRSQLLKE